MFLLLWLFNVFMFLRIFFGVCFFIKVGCGNFFFFCGFFGVFGLFFFGLLDCLFCGVFCRVIMFLGLLFIGLEEICCLFVFEFWIGFEVGFLIIDFDWFLVEDFDVVEFGRLECFVIFGFFFFLEFDWDLVESLCVFLFVFCFLIMVFFGCLFWILGDLFFVFIFFRGFL